MNLTTSLPEARGPNESRVHLLIAALVSIAMLISFVWTSIQINKQEIWFSNLDQDSVLIMNALRVNDHRSPTYYDHPSQGVYVIYGTIYRILNLAHVSPVGAFSDLESMKDPLAALPRIYYLGRYISICLSIFCAIAAATLVFTYSQKWEYSFWGFSFSLISPGLLFQSLVVRSELISVAFLCVAFLLILMTRGRARTVDLFFLSGIAFGFSYCTKIQALPYLLPLAILAASFGAEKEIGVPSRMTFFRISFFVCAIFFVFFLGFFAMGASHLLIALHIPGGFFKSILVSKIKLHPAAFIAVLGLCLTATVFLLLFGLVRKSLSLMKMSAMAVSRPMMAGFFFAMTVLLPLFGKWVEWILPGTERTSNWAHLVISSLTFFMGLVFFFERAISSGLRMVIRNSFFLTFGFLLSLNVSLVFSWVPGNLWSTTRASNRLLSLRSASQFAASEDKASLISSVSAYLSELKMFFIFYGKSSLLILVFLILIAVSMILIKINRKHLHAGLFVFSIGILLIGVSALRWYSMQYWIYCDFPIMGGIAILVIGILEKITKRPLDMFVRLFFATLAAGLGLSEYGLVKKEYAGYNIGFRDRIERAAKGFNEVVDMNRLADAKIGTESEMVERILLDPQLNGSDRGIRLLDRPNVLKALERYPGLKDRFLNKSVQPR